MHCVSCLFLLFLIIIFIVDVTRRDATRADRTGSEDGPEQCRANHAIPDRADTSAVCASL